MQYYNKPNLKAESNISQDLDSNNMLDLGKNEYLKNTLDFNILVESKNINSQLLEVEFVKSALLEDLGRGDLFSKIAEDKKASARVLAKESGIFSGKRYARTLLDLFNIKYSFSVQDGDKFNKNDILLNLTGSYLDILKIERTLLNMLQHSSGIATNVNSYIKILRDNNFDTILLDTRKTRPNLRIFEKYSVLNGGGVNHRLGLDDCLMLKDTNLAHIKDLKSFIETARKKIPFTSKIEVECENISSAKEVMRYGVDIIMCDNMNPREIKEVVDFRNANFSAVLLEVSGNISKDNILSYAKSGVDAISSGSLIHKAKFIDLSLKMNV